MKPNIVIAIAALLTSSIVPPIVASAPSDPHAYLVHDAFSNGGAVIIGTNETELLRLFGQPSLRLSDTLWVYESKFRAERTPTGDDHGCSTLVVTLSKGHIADMKLVNKSALHVIADSSRAGTKVQYRAQHEPIYATASTTDSTTRTMR